MSRENEQIVTIDGPSGVGKSTVSRAVAARLGYTYLDTGAMYRAVAWKCLQDGVPPDDEDAVARLLEDINIRLLPPEKDGDDVRVLVNGRDVSREIRSPEMAMAASRVSALGTVREKLTRMQQEMGAAGRIVAEGRDTGTVVFPRAAWKFFLDAAPGERARRRAEQLRLRGQEVDEKKILAQIIQRDRDDRERTIAPLRAAPDAIHIDTTNLDLDQVVDRILSHIRT
ncbi:MAG TPA: (d)CMP kinase [Desulfobulbus sp.]|nr:(d)CMP kinase [Desulfobulbus sp.]